MYAPLRRWPLALSLLPLLAACGGSPAAPSSDAVSAQSVASLQPGTYTLTVSQSSNSSPGPGGATFGSWVCMGMGSYPTTVEVPVEVAREAGGYTARALRGSLVLQLAVSGTQASGTLRGAAGDGTGHFSMVVEGPEPVSLGGSITGDRTASGQILTGSVNLVGPGGSGGCSPSSWALSSN
jgi:hypothetical protein